MRPSGKRFRREAPHPPESGIVQPESAVTAEDGAAFGEIVERFTLDADKLFEAPFQIEAFGDIVEQISDAAVGVGRGDDTKRAPAGQMPGMLPRLDSAIGFVQLRLPLPEILLL